MIGEITFKQEMKIKWICGICRKKNNQAVQMTKFLNLENLKSWTQVTSIIFIKPEVSKVYNMIVCYDVQIK